MMMRRIVHLTMGCLLFRDIRWCIHRSADFVKDRYAKDDSDRVVPPAPLLLHIELDRELCNLGAERVRKLHRPTAARRLSGSVAHYLWP